MSEIIIPLSIALHMSYIVRAATETAVNASISTPVLPDVFAIAVISMQFVFCIWLQKKNFLISFFFCFIRKKKFFFVMLERDWGECYYPPLPPYKNSYNFFFFGDRIQKTNC